VQSGLPGNFLGFTRTFRGKKPLVKEFPGPKTRVYPPRNPWFFGNGPNVPPVWGNGGEFTGLEFPFSLSQEEFNPLGRL